MPWPAIWRSTRSQRSSPRALTMSSGSVDRGVLDGRVDGGHPEVLFDPRSADSAELLGDVGRSSSTVSNSEASEAKSSSSFGQLLLARTSLTVTAKTASWPASSAAPYSSGKVTLTSTSSPALAPMICSSKSSISWPEPISIMWSLAAPPSNSSPSRLPTKSTSTWSPPRRRRSRPRRGWPCLHAGARFRGR